jgi:Fe-S-cluster containining protein
VLDVTLRVAVLEGDEDHDATWMLGHTERVEFGSTFTDDDELWVHARLHVPCRHLEERTDGTVRCRAHRFRGTVDRVPHTPGPRQLDGDQFNLVDGRRMRRRTLPHVSHTARELPVVEMPNPCATAPCRTGDNRRGAACCRDFQVDIRCDEDNELLEELIRNRKSPYLCKVNRDDGDDDLLNAEIISACGYLLEDGIHCSLHDRQRGDGRPAKPLLCTAWPKKRTGLHPGCVFANRRVQL